MRYLLPFLAFIMLLTSCDSTSDQVEAENAKVEALEAELEAERERQNELADRVENLEEELAEQLATPKGRISNFMEKTEKVSVQVDLGELDKSQIDAYNNELGLNPDPTSQTVSGSKGTFGKLIKEVIEEKILTSGLSEYSFIERQSWIRDSYWSYILAQLPKGVDIGYELYNYVEFKGGRDAPLAHLVFRADRNPNQIAKLWEIFGSFTLDLISEQTYRSSNLNRYVNSLIQTREHFKEIGLSSSDMEEIYDEVLRRQHTSEWGMYSTEAWDIYAPHLNDQVVSDWLIGGNNMEGDDFTWQPGAPDALWMHSFWIRRNHEGNAGIVFTILKEIRDHFDAE